MHYDIKNHMIYTLKENNRRELLINHHTTVSFLKANTPKVCGNLLKEIGKVRLACRPQLLDLIRNTVPPEDRDPDKIDMKYLVGGIFVLIKAVDFSPARMLTANQLATLGLGIMVDDSLDRFFFIKDPFGTSLLFREAEKEMALKAFFYMKKMPEVWDENQMITFVTLDLCHQSMYEPEE